MAHENVNSYKVKGKIPQSVYSAMNQWEREGDAGNEAQYAKADRVTAMLPMIVTGSKKCRRKIGRIVSVTRRLQAS